MSRESVRWRLRPGRASEYIRYAKDAIRPGDLVVLFARVSRSSNKAHLADALAELRKAAESMGAVVVDDISFVVLGYDPDEDQPSGSTSASWRGAIYKAAQLAKQLGAKLLAESTDRYVRHPSYAASGKRGPQYPDAQARPFDLETLAEETVGVTLTTLLHPDATPDAVRRYQAKRGRKKVTVKRLGRPPKKSRRGTKAYREEKQPIVHAWKLAGKRLGEIVELTGVSRRTVSRWIRRV